MMNSAALLCDEEKPVQPKLFAMDGRLCNRPIADHGDHCEREYAVTVVNGEIAVVDSFGGVASVVEALREQAV